MELEIYGAAKGVTGSCHILRVNGYQILLDCGLWQGNRKDEARNREPFPFAAEQLDAVILSHAHIDHSGRLPLLVKRGYQGPVYAQNATRDLCRVLLLDSASLAERDAVYENKRRQAKGQALVKPLYTTEDVLKTLTSFQGLRYGQQVEVCPGVVMRYYEAGHILGSAITELRLSEKGQSRTLLYTGDLGQYDTPILQDPAPPPPADVVLMESTYGNRVHRDRTLTIKEIGEVISAARHDKGNVLIPAFSIGRSQEILYLLGKHYREWGLERWQIFLDSPMAIEASQIYWKYPHLYDEEAGDLRRNIERMPILDDLHLTQSVEQSQAINRFKSGAIIIAGSGMCTGGRILHHLKQNVWREECHVLIVGFQAYGTLGRRLVNGEAQVRIHGQYYPVRSRIHTVGGLSAHADQNDLLHWAGLMKNNPLVLLVHGEPDVKDSFSELLADNLGLHARVPRAGDVIDLLNP